MQNGVIRKGGQGSPASVLGKRQRRETNLLCGTRIHARAQGPRYQLRPKADTHGRQTGGKPSFKHPDFRGKEGIAIILICAYGAAQNEQQIGLQRVEFLQVADTHVVIMHVVSRPHQNEFKARQIFKGDMADGGSNFQHSVSNECRLAGQSRRSKTLSRRHAHSVGPAASAQHSRPPCRRSFRHGSPRFV